jgi:predicted transcriptional regulator
MAKTDTKAMTAQVPLALANRVEQLSVRLVRSQGWIVEQALSDWVEREEERSRLTREAMDDVRAGRLIDHQTVQGWVDSLATENPLPAPVMP